MVVISHTDNTDITDYLLFCYVYLSHMDSIDITDYLLFCYVYLSHTDNTDITDFFDHGLNGYFLDDRPWSALFFNKGLYLQKHIENKLS